MFQLTFFVSPLRGSSDSLGVGFCYQSFTSTRFLLHNLIRILCNDLHYFKKWNYELGVICTFDFLIWFLCRLIFIVWRYCARQLWKKITSKQKHESTLQIHSNPKTNCVAVKECNRPNPLEPPKPRSGETKKCTSNEKLPINTPP